jgi:hypothetical protein
MLRKTFGGPRRVPLSSYWGATMRLVLVLNTRAQHVAGTLFPIPRRAYWQVIVRQECSPTPHFPADALTSISAAKLFGNLWLATCRPVGSCRVGVGLTSGASRTLLLVAEAGPSTIFGDVLSRHGLHPYPSNNVVPFLATQEEVLIVKSGTGMSTLRCIIVPTGLPAAAKFVVQSGQTAEP